MYTVYMYVRQCIFMYVCMYIYTYNTHKHTHTYTNTLQLCASDNRDAAVQRAAQVGAEARDSEAHAWLSSGMQY